MTTTNEPQAMTRAEKEARARELRAEGLLFREIAAAMGVSITTVDGWLNDPGGKNLAARKRSYAGSCVDCGAPTDGSNGRLTPAVRCSPCAHRFEHESRYWTRERIVERIREWERRHGSPPRASDWSPGARGFDAERFYGPSGVAEWPGSNTVVREFGSHPDALRAAGFEPWRERFNTPYRDDPEGTLTDIARRHRAGETLREIAAAHQISQSRVRQLLDKAGVPRRRKGKA